MFDGSCFIRRAGILADGRAQVGIKAVDGTFDWHWAWSSPTRGREVLAVALTAIATNRQVTCNINDPMASSLSLDGYFGIES